MALLHSGSVTAQVVINYKEYLTGTADVADIAAISVLNSTGVEIDYIYKGWVTDESGNEVMRIESEVLTQSWGLANYHKTDQLDESDKAEWEYRIIHQEIDLAHYSGKLTFHSDLVHPLDTSSIIASESKAVSLEEGLYLDKNGSPMYDPRLLEINLAYHHEPIFELNYIIDLMVCSNYNQTPCCVPVEYEISQGATILYKASIKSLCIPPGEHTVQASNPEIVVLLNKYDERLPDEPIKVKYGFGEAGMRYSEIYPQRHSPQPKTYIPYRNEALGLEVDFMAGAVPNFIPDASKMLMVFDTEGQVEEVALLEAGSFLPLHTMGLNNPYGMYLRRDDVNGAFLLQTLDATQFTGHQWRAIVANANHTAPDQVRCFQYHDLEVCVPNQLHHVIRYPNAPRPLDLFSCFIMDNDRLLLLHLMTVLPGDKNENIIIPVDVIDRMKVLNSMHYHGVQLEFVYDSTGMLETMRFHDALNKAASERKQQYEKYLLYDHALKQLGDLYSEVWTGEYNYNQTLLDKLIKSNDITTLSPMSSFSILTPENDTIRHYRPFIWEDGNLRFLHRFNETTADEPVFSNAKIAYQLDEKGVITAAEQLEENVPAGLENAIVLPGKSMDFYVLNNESITLRAMPANAVSIEDARRIVYFENGNEIFPEVEILEYPLGDWHFIISRDLLNPGQWVGKKNVFMLFTHKAVYKIGMSQQFRYKGKITSLDGDFLQFFNSLEVEGRKLVFQYDFHHQLEKIDFQD